MIPDTDAFLARLTAELEQISVQQHALARRREVLIWARKELSIGVVPSVIEAYLQAYLPDPVLGKECA